MFLLLRIYNPPSSPLETPTHERKKCRLRGNAPGRRPITCRSSDEAQLSQRFAREFSHAKMALLPESRRDR